VHMPAVQARHAAPLLPATPAADILGVDAAYDKRPPLGLPCEPATRRLGSAAPTGCRAQLYFRLKHLGRLVQHSRLSTDKGSDIFSFSRGGVKVVVTSRKVTIRSIEPLSVFWQEKTACSSRFHASCSRISSKGLLILWGHCSEHRNFSSLRKRPSFWSTVDRRERGRTLCG
jgi:hypothetical protein